MKRIALVILLMIAPAHAQTMLGYVVESCGKLPTQFKSGNPAPFTVDTTGTLCIGASSSVGTITFSGVPTSTGLGVATCGNQTFKAGNPGPYTVDVNGNLCSN